MTLETPVPPLLLMLREKHQSSKVGQVSQTIHPHFCGKSQKLKNSTPKLTLSVQNANIKRNKGVLCVDRKLASFAESVQSSGVQSSVSAFPEH